MDSKLVKIVLSCKTPEQVTQCMEWVSGLQTLQIEDKDLLLEILSRKKNDLKPLEVF